MAPRDLFFTRVRSLDKRGIAQMFNFLSEISIEPVDHLVYGKCWKLFSTYFGISGLQNRRYTLINKDIKIEFEYQKESKLFYFNFGIDWLNEKEEQDFFLIIQWLKISLIVQKFSTNF